MEKIIEIEKELQNLKKLLKNDKKIEFEDENIENSDNNDKIEIKEEYKDLPIIPKKKSINISKEKRNLKSKSIEKISDNNGKIIKKK